MTGVFCLFLVPYGIVGAAFAITIPYIIGRLLILPLIVHKFLPFPLSKIVIRVFIYWILTGALSWLIMGLYPELDSLSLLMLLALTPVYLLVHLPIGFVLVDRFERNWLASKIFKIKNTS
jgi:hypothetical protein